MREAAHRAVSGPASSDRLAAGGGLEVPATTGSPGEKEAFHQHGVHETAASGLIPGARELDNLTHREPGAVSGSFNGSDIPTASNDLLDEADRVELYREGGLDHKAAARKARSHDDKP